MTSDEERAVDACLDLLARTVQAHSAELAALRARLAVVEVACLRVPAPIPYIDPYIPQGTP